MNGKVLSKQELLRFELKAYLQSQESKRKIAEYDRQDFEEHAAQLFTLISELFANEPGIQVITGEDPTQNSASNVGWLEIDIVGKKVKISPILKEGERVLDVSGFEQDFHFKLEHKQWYAMPKPGYGWTTLNDDFWFTKLAELIPK